MAEVYWDGLCVAKKSSVLETEEGRDKTTKSTDVMDENTGIRGPLLESRAS